MTEYCKNRLEKQFWVAVCTTDLDFDQLRLCLQYRNPWDQVRVGKLLEDLDSLAGNIAFQHW